MKDRRRRRIVVVAFGSRGDVQPMAALAVALRDAGHDVAMATHRNFEEFVRGLGLEFRPVAVDSRAVMESEAGQEWIGIGGGTIRSAVSSLRQFARILSDESEAVATDTLDACRGCDAIAGNAVVFFLGHCLSEGLGVPFFDVQLQPSYPTRRFESSFFPAAPRWVPAAGYNLASHLVTGFALWGGLRRSVNRVRARVLGLPPWPLFGPYEMVKRLGVPDFCAFSPAIVPHPPDWPRRVRTTGYFFLDGPSSWAPPADLARFLGAGPAPVYVGFGSMVPPDPAATAEAVLAALGRTGSRAVLARGWGGLKALAGRPLPDSFHVLEEAPHKWLFPRMATVIHHCGAGTTAAALRAGVPTVGVPFFADQPFWARRVHAAGAGPAPIAVARLTGAALAEALELAAEGTMRSRAAAIGTAIRGEDGVGRAVEIIEEFLVERESRRRHRGAAREQGGRT